ERATAAGRAAALPAVALSPLRAAASTAAPVPEGVVATGSVAAGLLWAVTAGVARSALAGPARRR
ncbi:MAG TPA: hypothetical protein VM263_09605, partial [Acidimicrobiales bacterium]|nr:hypothetical protein [Acidimicrobiales bacterium]